MQNFIQKGDVLEYVVPAGGVKSGDVVVAGTLVGVAVKDGVQGEVVAVNLTGVFELPKATGALTLGQAVYYSAANKNITATATDNVAIGHVFVAAASADAVVRVRLRN